MFRTPITDRVKAILAIMACLGPFALIPASVALASDNPRVAKGHTLAVQRCSRCHAVERTGASPLEAAPPFRTLGRHYPVESLDEALAEGIMVGHADMPSEPWEPEDIDSFIAYLKTITPPQLR